MFHNFLPKEFNFFDLFEKQVGFAVEAAKYFKVIAAKEKKYVLMVTDIISDYLNGSVPSHKLKAMSYTLFGMSNAIMYWYDTEGPVTLDELSELCYDIFIKGISSYKQPS